MKKKKILLIDDEDNFRAGVKIALKKHGYQVTDAADGHEGMEHIIKIMTDFEKYSLIILDIMMPKISGVDILEYIVHKKIDTPVLIITGFINYDIKCFCSRLKDVQILQKPFSYSEFFTKVTEMINSKQQVEETA